MISKFIEPPSVKEKKVERHVNSSNCIFANKLLEQRIIVGSVVSHSKLSENLVEDITFVMIVAQMGTLNRNTLQLNCVGISF